MLGLLDAAGNDGLTSGELLALEPNLFQDTTAVAGTLHSMFITKRVVRIRDFSKSKFQKWCYRYYHPKSQRGQELLGRKPLPPVNGGASKKNGVTVGSTPVLNGTAPLVRLEARYVIKLGNAEHSLSIDEAKTLLQSLTSLLPVGVHSHDHR